MFAKNTIKPIRAVLQDSLHRPIHLLASQVMSSLTKSQNINV